jgi:hypothetical protein
MNNMNENAVNSSLPLRPPRGRSALLALGLAALWTVPGAHALSLDIRPIDFGNGLTATGTITTAGNTSSIVDWQLTVSSFERLAHYTKTNTPLALVSDVSVSGDGQAMNVATSPDGEQDGGALGFRHKNPSANWGVSVADFSSNFQSGGEAFYIAGGAFEFLPLNQPNGAAYLAATANPAGGNLFDLVPLTFSNGVTMYGSILTNGQTGPLGPNSILAWDIFVDMVTEDVFDKTNSKLSASLLGLSPDGQLTVDNPDGRLAFVKGIVGGHLYGLVLADFMDSPHGTAGYYQGAFSITTVGLGAPKGPWEVTGDEPIAVVPEPGSFALFVLGALGLALPRLRRPARPWLAVARGQAP